MLIKIADAYPCNKKTYNSAVSALRRAACGVRRAFDFGTSTIPSDAILPLHSNAPGSASPIPKSIAAEIENTWSTNAGPAE